MPWPSNFETLGILHKFLSGDAGCQSIHAVAVSAFFTGHIGDHRLGFLVNKWTCDSRGGIALLLAGLLSQLSGDSETTPVTNPDEAEDSP